VLAQTLWSAGYVVFRAVLRKVWPLSILVVILRVLRGTTMASFPFALIFGI
jgi:hypothetical protein